MRKSELISKIAETFPDIPLKAIEESVNIIFESIAEAMAKGERVEVRGFGTFEGRNRSARRARNPRAGIEITLPARIYPFFKASKEMISFLNSD